MYIFVTYGDKRIRGVQVRGLRVAKYFDKKEVLFWNSGDDGIIKKENYSCIKININSFGLIKDVVFPDNLKAVVFCDLPTNRAYQISILMAAIEKKIPTIILDNIYRFSQLREKTFFNVLQYCDLFALNGLSLFKKAEKFNNKIKIIPPLVKKYAIGNAYENFIKNKYKINASKKIILSIGYNKDTLKNILKLAKIFEKIDLNLTFVIPGNFKKVIFTKNVIKTPILEEKELNYLIDLSNLVICKFAYLQILEILALGKIAVAVGARGLKPEWLEKSLLKVIPYYPEITPKAIREIKKLISNSPQRKILHSMIRKIHDGSIDGGRIIADLIRNTKYSPKNIGKVILFFLDKNPEIKIANKIINKNNFIFPVIISVPWFSNIQKFILTHGQRCLSDFWQKEKDILPCNFNLLMNFYPNSFHSFTQIFPFYEIITKNIRKLAEESDKIIVVGRDTDLLMANLLKGLENKKEII